MYFYFRLSVLVTVFVIFSSCQAEEVETLSERQLTEDINSEEYLKAEIDGIEIIITKQNKYSDELALGAEFFRWIDTDKIEHYSLRFWATRKNAKGEETRSFAGYIEDYDGPGTYSTGTNLSANFCHFFDYGTSWYSDRSNRDRGIIEILSDSGGFLNGKFNYTGYNTNHRSKSRRITGEFRVLIHD